jgi:outer membrane protein OmpA-like peptidoglycan-associated protein
VRATTTLAAAPPLQIQVPREKVDLKDHHLEIVLSRDPAKVHIIVIGESGATLADSEQDFSGHRAGAPLVLTWQPTSDEPVAKIEIKAYDQNDFYTGVMLTPWSVYIPHEEVNFKTGSAAVEASEEGKLEASVTKINAALEMHKEIEKSVRLFIAGHTDRVGNDGYNLKLSAARAQAIARWFRGHGLRLPIAYEGFGERAPAVNTADGVDEPRNRRVDYILSVDEPAVRTTGFRPVWKRVN